MGNTLTSSRSKRRIAAAIIALTATAGLFQNCSEGFKAAIYSEGSSSSGDNGPDNVIPINLPAFPGVSMPNFKTCYTASADPALLASCLNQQPGTMGIVYTAAAISSCQTNGNTTELFLAICLSSNGQVIQDHRDAKQFDIEQCVTAGGQNGVSNCLAARGLRGRVQQEFVDTCVASAGLTGVERCLRSKGYLNRRPAIMQTDVNLCTKVAGAAGVALCLQNADLVQATVTQANIDACVTNLGAGFVAKCLRNQYRVPRVLMQAQFNDCNSTAGPAAIATCLDNNGLLPNTFASVAAGQTEIDTCVATAGVAGVAKCLRGKNLVAPKIMQPHIQACFNAVGANNTFTCLSSNFAVPAALTDAALKTCFSQNGGTAAGAAPCLAAARILPSAPSQEHINICAGMAGLDADATGNFPGQIGIAACLNGSGLLAAPLVQANINTCITNVGQANVATCLHNNNIVPSFSRMSAAAGVLGTNCASCHNATLANGNLDVSVYSSVLAKVVRGNSAASVLAMRINNTAAPMPPTGLMAQPQRDQIARWIDQGANEN